MLSFDAFDRTQSNFPDGVVGPVRNEPVADDFDLVNSAVVGWGLEIAGQGRLANQTLKKVFDHSPVARRRPRNTSKTVSGATIS
ncbi:MAG: hypothetical protein HZA93_00080 [Verrucomicrobia bacterium]|nr:hypothetical protein [Verrucomicrobiota bacterium]